MNKPSISRPVAVTLVSMFLAWPLWREFHEPDQPAWNVFLALLMLGLVIATFFGLRYLETSKAELGEARFRTSKPKG